MTSFNMTGASSTSPPTWDTVPWPKVEWQVRRLQMRIAKAFREGHRHKVQALQRLLTHSGSAKLLAVRRVTTNTGRHTPGIDGVRWTTPKQKWQAVATLRRHGSEVTFQHALCGGKSMLKSGQINCFKTGHL